MQKPAKYLCLALFAIYGVMSLWLLYPYDFPIAEAMKGHDDWNHYARYAYDIKTNGLLLSLVQGAYLYPAGFLYNYFVALFLWLGNDNLWLVYMLQGLMLPGAICIVYSLFAPKLPPVQRYALFMALAITGFLDIFRHYSFLLLSENLAILTLPLSFYFLQQYENGNRQVKLLLSVFFLAVSVLIRPNVFPFSILMLGVIILHLYFRHKRRIPFVLLVYGMVFSLLAFRNYLVTGDLVFLPVNGSFTEYMGRVNLHSPTDEPGAFLNYYLDRLLFVIGYLPAVEPVYSIRPHWMLIWAGVGILLYRLLRKKVQLNLTQWIMLLFLASYFGVLILIAPIHVYGFRMITPAVFFVVGFGFVGVNRLVGSWKAKV